MEIYITMEQFYMVVSGVATIILILILIFVGIMMQYQNAGNTWPPINNTCPDYWDVAIDGSSCVIPVNSGTTTISGQNIGTLTGSAASTNQNYTTVGGVQVIDPSNPNWTTQGKTPLCAMGAWASQNNIQWSGYSNSNSCK